MNVNRANLPNALKVLGGLIVSALFVCLFLRGIRLEDVQGTLAASDLRWVPVALGSLAVGYTARISRWWLMLRGVDPGLRWTEAGAPFLVSIAVNNVAPLRGGDILRLFAFRSRPQLNAPTVLATLIVERLLDLSALLALFFVVLPFVATAEVPAEMVQMATVVAGLGAAVGVSVVLLPSFGSKVIAKLSNLTGERPSSGLGRVLGACSQVFETIRGVSARRSIIPVVLLTPIAWASEGGVFVAAALASGAEGGALAAFFALATATLATLLPSSPGYVGTFHFFAAAAVMAFGTSAVIAAAFAITVHFVLWGATTLVGFIIFLVSLSGSHRCLASTAQDVDNPELKGLRNA